MRSASPCAHSHVLLFILAVLVAFVAARRFVAITAAGPLAASAIALQVQKQTDPKSSTTTVSGAGSSPATAASSAATELPDDPWLTKVGNIDVERLPLGTPDNHNPWSIFPIKANKFLLHTMDGNAGKGNWESGQETLAAKHGWPHFVVAYDKNNKIRVGQYFPITQGSYAVVGENNRKDLVQVEIGANSASNFTKDFPELAKVVHELFVALNKATHGRIPLCMDTRVPHFYDAAHATHTVAEKDLKELQGLIGHQHMHTPEHSSVKEDHGDPGPICAELIITGNPCVEKNHAVTTCQSLGLVKSDNSASVNTAPVNTPISKKRKREEQ